MNMVFATCERQRALRFIRQAYSNQDITDTEDSAKPVLDLIEADIIRISDPSMHYPTGIYPSINFDNSKAKEIVAILNTFNQAALTAGRKQVKGEIL